MKSVKNMSTSISDVRYESQRNLPILADVDVLVVGGSSGGVAAAVAAAKEGASVFQVAERTYFGEDITGTCRYWLENGEYAQTGLAKMIFKKADDMPPAPLHIKKALDNALLEADVDFVLGSTVTDVVVDKSGNLAGVVISSRSGRQVITAKKIIDATHRATVARLCDTPFTPFKKRMWTFQRSVIGGNPVKHKSLKSRLMPTHVAGYVKEGKAKNVETTYPVTEYTIKLKLAKNTWQAFADLEQQARDLTWHEGQAATSEFVYYIPPDCVDISPDTPWSFSDKASMKPFQVPNQKNLFILSGSASMDRKSAGNLLRPVEYLRVGEWLGKSVVSSKQPKRITTPLTVAPLAEQRSSIGDCCELSYDPGRATIGSITSPASALPVIGSYDVVVMGGGTGGAPAGIGAARRGAKTLVVEFLHGLGGVGTLGMISRYWYGNITGFTKEVDRGSKAWKLGWGAWDIERKMEWYRSELRKAGADIWFHCSNGGVYMVDNVVKGVIVNTPFGRGVVLCKTVIDSTGNADVAVAAGSRQRFIEKDIFALQGAGLSFTAPGILYINTDWTYVDDSNLNDRTRAHVTAREKMKDQLDISEHINTRERRSVIGDYTLTPLDVICQKTFRDTILRGTSNVDSHGYTTHPVFRLDFPHVRDALFTDMPYRCLLPTGVEGILVTGLSASVHRDALPVVRMQGDIQNQGYAAGVAAAMAVAANILPRYIDIKELQQHLVEIGNLKPSVLKHSDSQGPSPSKIRKAIKSISLTPEADYVHYGVIMQGGNTSIPLLEEAYNGADGELKVAFAHCLGLMGNKTGLATIRDYIRTHDWDEGWTFTGMGNHGSGFSLIDSLIVILGALGEPADCEIIHDKMKGLTLESEFSHFRSPALALERLKSPKSAKPLAKLLALKGIQDHAFTNLDKALKDTPPDSRDNSTREKALRELVLARALYRCGDSNGLGQSILEAYANDIRGVFQIHARQVLRNCQS